MLGAVGVVANPASARDLRRLVADGSAVTAHDKLTLIRRVMAGLAATGVQAVLSMQDAGGISSGLADLLDRPSARDWPPLRFVDHPLTHGAADTVAAVTAMVAAGVGAIVVIGGDGTNRVVATACGDVPLMPISTGTNNAFPGPAEATVAGIAAGLVATGRVRPLDAGHRCKRLIVAQGERREQAVVDVAVVHTDGVGAGAVTDPDLVSELYLCLAEPHSIGLSAIGAHLRPVGREDPDGLIVRLGAPAITTVAPPIAPGRVVKIDVAAVETLHAQRPTVVHARRGVIAIDGERVFAFDAADDPPVVTLDRSGPIVIDVPRAMRYAACGGALSHPRRSHPIHDPEAMTEGAAR